jgi:hypothetical protein
MAHKVNSLSRQINRNHRNSAFLGQAPSGSSILEFSEYLKKCNSNLDTLKRLAGDPKAQNKYAETDRWIRKLRVDWKPVLNQTAFPKTVEYENVPIVASRSM